MVTTALKRSGNVRFPAEGQHSARPFEVCQRYAAGELTREETIATLSTWPYTPAGDIRTSPGDDIIVIPEGTIHELYNAQLSGLIDSDMRQAVREARRDGA